MNEPMRFGEPTEVADGIFCIPTDYPEVADAPLWTHLLRGETLDADRLRRPVDLRRGVRATRSRGSASTPREIRWILLTHGHPDHMGGHPGLQPARAVQGRRPARGRDLGRVGRAPVARLLGSLPRDLLARRNQRDEIVAMCGGDLPVDRILRDGDVVRARRPQPRGRAARVGTPAATAPLRARRPASSSAATSVQGHGIPSSRERASSRRSTTTSTTTCAGLRGCARCPSRCSAARTSLPLDREEGLALIDDSIAFVDETDALVARPARRRADEPRDRRRTSRRDRATFAAPTPPVSIQTVYTATAHLQACGAQRPRRASVGAGGAPSVSGRSSCAGITWDHERGRDPLLATAERVRGRDAGSASPGTCARCRASRMRSIPDLAQRYDLLVLDHPHIGEIVPTGALLPLDELLDAAFIADQAPTRSGRATRATSGTATSGRSRSTLPGTSAPTGPTCSSASAPGCPRRGTTSGSSTRRPAAGHARLASASKAVDTLATWLTLRRTPASSPTPDEERLAARATWRSSSSRRSRRLAEMPAPPTRSPGTRSSLLEHMATADDVVYCPILFGYSNYSRPGFRGTSSSSGRSRPRASARAAA